MMGMQKFAAREKFEFANGAIGWRPGGPMDCLGPWAKVQNCPIAGTDLRRTCYATGYADTFFSVPACTRVNGKYVGGYFSQDSEGGAVFHPMDRYKDRLPARIKPHWFEPFETESANSAGAWCKHCNCALAGDGGEHFSKDQFCDFVTSHGFGEPTAEGYAVGLELLSTGDDMATAAAEVSARGLTFDAEG